MSEPQIFPWNTIFEVGVEEIDNQHIKLVKLINEICSCVLSTNNYEETINDLFVQLIEYTKYHFQSEEHYFEKHFLPKSLLDKHKLSHAELISQVFFLKSKYDDDPNKDTNMEEILTTLVLWLTEHILVDDMHMCMITSNISRKMDVDEAVWKADADMQGSKGTLARVMGSMMHVSSASVFELRREIAFRKKLEVQLNEEISMRKDAEERLAHLAQHDTLTGLANRRLFVELCGAALKNARRTQSAQALLFVDIDGFKKINDTLGHQAGDALLISISRRLEECVREADIVARIGGDEFTIHLGGDCSEDEVTNVASRIIASISLPFELEEGGANVGASVGIAVYPSDGKDVETLMKNADAAMYLAKKTGKNAYRFFKEC